MSNKLKKQKLFDMYSANLTAIKQALKPHLKIEPDISDTFICPLCLEKLFLRGALEVENVLTGEHVPSKKAGGKIRTLTCQSCNNDAGGSDLESALSGKLNIDDILSGYSNEPLRAEWAIDGVRLPVNEFLSEGNKIIITIPSEVQSKSKQQVENFHQKLTQSTIHVNMWHRFPNQRKVNIALLRAGYLWAFSVFGYSFLLFNPALEVIREQIRNPKELILPSVGRTKSNYPDTVLGVNLVTFPKELQSVMVVIELKSQHRTRTRYGIFLPGPSEPGLKIYDWLTAHEQVERITINAINLNHINFLDEPLAFWDYWNSLP